eukprot:SAG11_NODE_15668_length_570_cov_0.859873_1_plen_75_part_00
MRPTTSPSVEPPPSFRAFFHGLTDEGAAVAGQHNASLGTLGEVVALPAGTTRASLLARLRALEGSAPLASASAR